MHQWSKWGLFGAVSHAVLSGRLFRSPAGSGCALCGEHPRGEAFVLLYDKELCRRCIDGAVTFFAVEGAERSEEAGRCVSCQAGDVLFHGERGSICRDCSESFASALAHRCGVRV